MLNIFVSKFPYPILNMIILTVINITILFNNAIDVFIKTTAPLINSWH